MSPRNDDSNVSRRTIDPRTADALLSGRPVDSEPELTALIAALRTAHVAPAPNAALAAMLATGFTPDRVTTTPATSRRTWALPLQIGLGTATCLGLLFGAAAAGELPDPAQTAVADVVEAVTPLHVPRPAKHPQPAVVPSPAHTTRPSPHATGPATAEHPDDRPTGSPRPDDHSGTGLGSDDSPTGSPQPDDHSGRGSGISGSGSNGSGSNGSGSSGSGSSGSGSSGSSAGKDSGRSSSSRSRGGGDDRVRGGSDGSTHGSGSEGFSAPDNNLNGSGDN